jgi:hypothetical protein
MVTSVKQKIEMVRKLLTERFGDRPFDFKDLSRAMDESDCGLTPFVIEQTVDVMLYRNIIDILPPNDHFKGHGRIPIKYLRDFKYKVGKE